MSELIFGLFVVLYCWLKVAYNLVGLIIVLLWGAAVLIYRFVKWCCVGKVKEV